MGKVLFIRGGAIGDFVLTMPAMQLLRDSLPENEVEILGDPGMTELAIHSGLADRTRSIHDPKLATFYAPGAKLDSEWCRYFAEFDLVLSYLYDPDSYFEENLEKAGVKTLFTFPGQIEEAPGSPSAIQQLAQPLEQLALFLDNPHVELEFESPGTSEKRTIVIHPGSGDSLRNWGFESWAELIDRISKEKPDLHFKIVSGHGEVAIIEDLRELVLNSGASCEFLSNPEFIELAQLFQQAELYLGQDSGISQLAACTGTEGFVLFGPRDPEIWAPVSKSIHCLRSSTGFLQAIRVEEVVSKAIDLLDS